MSVIGQSLTSFFSDFSRTKLFLIVFILSIITVLLGLKIGGFAATAIVIVPAILSILQITKGVWTPEGGGKSKIGVVSLGVALVAISTSSTWRPFIDSLLEPLYSKYPTLRARVPADSPSIIGLLFLGVVILIVNFFARDTTAMRQHPTPLDKEFPERNYKQLLTSFCGLLLDDLRNIDRETNWSAELFIPLDAEVEVRRTGSNKRKRITDLLSAIRGDRNTRAFLVLGDPGSGKSVALRKLCQDLLHEVNSTGKVPLYINLKEWSIDRTWSEKDPPTVEELYEFVVTNLKQRGDVFTSDFIDKYFKKMFENGRLFFVFDSFDEIPSVLDEAENSWLINELSRVIYRFLSGAHSSRGVLASRIFRRPTERFDSTTILEIRPFSEKKIIQTLKKSLSFDEKLVTELFTLRRDLVPIARNPFSAALISSYAKEHNNELPGTQAELYANYIRRRLSACELKVSSKGLTQAEVLEVTTELAYTMFCSERQGLEASVDKLIARLKDLPINDVVEILSYARIARLGGGPRRRFSFVHRRFNEYFVVQKLISNPLLVPRESIPRDSRWRDALVLYCEVAAQGEAEQLALFCWSQINLVSKSGEVKGPQYLAAVHCLRFLRDAFRGRLKCIADFRSELADFINGQISKSNSLLAKKLAVEAVGLLHERDIENAIQLALSVNNPWVSETALKACYYLPKLSGTLVERLQIAIDRMDTFDFVRQHGDLAFSFRLSNTFTELRRFCNARFADCVGLAVLMILVFLANPVQGMICLSFMYLQPWIFAGPSEGGVGKVMAWRLAILSPLWSAYATVLWLNYLLGVAHKRVPTQGMKLPYAIWLGAFLLIPWYQIYSYRRTLFRKRRLTPPSLRTIGAAFVNLYRSITRRRVLVSIGVLLALSALIWGIRLLWPSIPGGVKSGFVVVVAVWCLYDQVKNPIRNAYFRLRDRRKNDDFLLGSPMTRIGIVAQLNSLKSREGRLHLLSELDVRQITPSGEWPNGVLPTSKDSAIISRLAQLEEKWLGLNR